MLQKHKNKQKNTLKTNEQIISPLPMYQLLIFSFQMKYIWPNTVECHFYFLCSQINTLNFFLTTFSILYPSPYYQPSFSGLKSFCLNVNTFIKVIREHCEDCRLRTLLLYYLLKLLIYWQHLRWHTQAVLFIHPLCVECLLYARHCTSW